MLFRSLLLGVLKPTAGEVRLKGRALSGLGARERARVIAYLSQEEVSPFAFPVLDLVLMGRYPHRGRLERERLQHLLVDLHVEPVDGEIVLRDLIGQDGVPLPHGAQRLLEDRLGAAPHAEQILAELFDDDVEDAAHP